MKKHILAAAVAATFGVPAVAQVTVSGNVDVAAHRANKVTTLTGTTTATTDQRSVGSGSSGTDTTTTGWATSELIFTATEDLGGGLKATAVFSQDISGNLLGVARDRSVAVAGGFGTVRMGRFNSVVGGLNNYSGAGTTGQAGSLEQMTSGREQLFGAAIANNPSLQRNSGLVQFTTPSFNGFTAAAVYGKNSNDLSTTANSVTSSQQHGIGLAYTAGPLKVEFVSSQRKNKTAAVAGIQAQAFFFNGTNNNTGVQTTAGTLAVGAAVGAQASNFTQSTSAAAVAAGNPTTSALQGVVTVAGLTAASAVNATHDLDWLGASYNLGPASLSVVHARRKAVANTTASLVQGTLHDATINGIGVIVPSGAITFRASAYSGKDERATGNTDDAKLSGHQVSATYSLSKRTYLYAVMGESDVKRETATSTILERKEKSNSIGVVHTF